MKKIQLSPYTFIGILLVLLSFLPTLPVSFVLPGYDNNGNEVTTRIFYIDPIINRFDDVPWLVYLWMIPIVMGLFLVISSLLKGKFTINGNKWILGNKTLKWTSVVGIVTFLFSYIIALLHWPNF